MKFIGITGSNGKTTTATLIYEILRKCGYKAGFIGTGKIISDGVVLTDSTYSMTTPDPTLLFPSIARMQADGCEYIVMEVSSHSIALGKIDPIYFEYAIFTNLDSDHLDFHKTKEDYFNTKLRLFEKTKMGLFNIDDDYVRQAYDRSNCDKRSLGIINRADVFATEVELKSLDKSSFFYREKDLIFKARINVGGAFNVYNALSALKCVIDLGIKPCIVKEALAAVEHVDGRMEIIEGYVRAVIDYAHTPMAFYNLLKTLKIKINPKQSMILVFGCGGDRDKTKRSEFGKYAEMFADKIIITEDNSRTEPFPAIADDIVRGIKSKTYTIIEDREKAIKYAFKSAKQGDVIAVIGKGHERYKIIGNDYIAFDERKIIRECMKEKESVITYANRA
jgi:UDP-N-acetylmuramoyl-L-alanyl-D-glutamate--2,6-diaminopimelate ligase